MHMRKIYISCHHPDPANALAAELVAAGHEVLSKWHVDPTPRPAKDDARAWGANAERNFAAIREANVLILIAGPDRYPGGKFVEAGYALSAGRDVITVGGVENGMLYHQDVGHAADTAELLLLLAD